MLKLIDDALIERLAGEAAASPRQRSHHNIHESFGEPVQKLLVAATRDSYFRPHRHRDKSEFAVALRGRFDVILFDDKGRIGRRQSVGDDTGISALEIPAGIWHCWLVTSEHGVFFEAKQGPYNPETAAESAPWAPPERTPEAAAYLEDLRRRME